MVQKRQTMAPADDGGADAASASLGDRKMEQIRDILFGSLSRDYDRRFAELGERIARELARVSQETERRLGAMEARVDAASERVLTQLRQEATARTAADEDLESRLFQALRTQRGELSGHLDRVEKELAQNEVRMRESLTGLHAELTAAVQNLRDALTGERQQMRADKVGREDLADLMNELAMRLRGTLDLTGID